MTSQLPLTPAAFAALALAVLTMVGGYVGVVLPRSRTVADLERQVATTRSQLGAAAQIAPISEGERERWAELQQLVRSRFVAAEDQYRLVVEVGRVARLSGLMVTRLGLEDPTLVAAAGEGAAAAESPFAPPPPLAPNAGVIAIAARHRYGDLVDFLDRLGRGATYVALRSVDIRRADGHLESEIRLASLRWTQE